MVPEQKPPRSDDETWLNGRIGKQGNLEALVRFECAMTDDKGLPCAVRVVEQPPTHVEDDGAEGSYSLE